MSSLIEPEGVVRNMLVVSTTLTGLTLLEYAWNVQFEVRVIWPQFWKSAEAKIFVAARYVGLATQIFNVWFVTRMASGIPSNLLACRGWYSYQIVTIQYLLMSVELLLMLLACKMYNNNKFVIGILLVFAGVQCAGTAVAARMVVPSIGFSPTCVVVHSHPGQIYTGASTIAVYLCFLGVISWKYVRGNWPKILCRYLKITVRDSIGIVVVVTGIYFPLILAPMGQTIENIICPVMTFSFWFAAGRLVLDTERFRQEFQNDCELTEVDLDDLETPDDSDVCPARP